MAAHGILRTRLDRLADRRQQLQDEIAQTLTLIEADKRMTSAAEEDRLNRRREELKEIEKELVPLADDLHRMEASLETSAMLRRTEAHEAASGVYRTFAQYARDQMIVRFPQIAEVAGGGSDSVGVTQELAQERLYRTVQNTTSTTVAGLVPAQHMAQILDVIDSSRPIVASGRSTPLIRGKLNFPQIDTRPTVTLQPSEKSEGGTIAMAVSMGELAASTYIGGGDLSWQALNWSTPDALQLWFDLAAEAYARQTETVAGTALGTVTVGTISPVLGTAGTESFDQWRAAVLDAAEAINSATGGRVNPNAMYLSPKRFFQLAGLSSTAPLQLSAVGQVDVGQLTGTFSGLRVIGSYGLSGNGTIVGDASALLVAETPGAPVELRVVEPTIGGMQVGVIGAFASRVFDSDRFVKLNA